MIYPQLSSAENPSNKNRSQISLHKLRINEQAIMAILGAVVGLGGGFGAIAFRHLIELFQFLVYGSQGNLLEIAQQTPWYLKLWVPALGGLVVGPLVYFLAKEAKGHGVPEVMEAVALRKGVIRKRVAFVKILASAICIGTGGSVGREGPIVQIGSAIGSAIGQIVRVSAERIRTLVGCGAAAGIAATFNAPIAGSMFALEIILGDFGLATFSPIVISSVVATAISRHHLGNSPAITVPPYQLASAWELPLYVILGLFCAVVGVTFTRTLYKAEDLFSEVKMPEYLKGVVGGFIIGIMALLFPHVLGVGYPAIELALMGKLSLLFMLLLVLFKILATSVTIGSGGSGGIFAPSLFLGSMAGGFFGTIVHAFLPGVTANPGAYSTVGMGAVVSATTHGPLTAILILFEMTGNYRIILPLMIACIIGSLASGQLLKESIYTMKLSRRGVNIRAGKDVNLLRSILVQDAMSHAVETIPEGFPLTKLAESLTDSKYHSFPVIDKDGNLTGILSYLDYHDVIHDRNLDHLIVAKDIATSEVISVYPDESLYAALEKITPKDLSILPVVSKENSKKILGIITRRDIIGAYNSAVVKKPIIRQ
jgi:CIC family chloride channel protein